MIDVHLPTTDGRELVPTRYTQPEPELQLLINQLKFELPRRSNRPRLPPTIKLTSNCRSENLLT